MDWQPFGTHEARSEDDLLELRLRATVDERDIAELFRRVTELKQHYPRIFLLVDVSQSETLTPAGRRYAVEWIRSHPDDDGVAVLYGASPTVRALGSLLNAAVRILSGRQTRNHFVKTEAEARTMLVELRAELAAK